MAKGIKIHRCDLCGKEVSSSRKTKVLRQISQNPYSNEYVVALELRPVVIFGGRRSVLCDFCWRHLVDKFIDTAHRLLIKGEKLV